jgi:hypothetical protein
VSGCAATVVADDRIARGDQRRGLLSVSSSCILVTYGGGQRSRLPQAVHQLHGARSPIRRARRRGAAAPFRDGLPGVRAYSHHPDIGREVNDVGAEYLARRREAPFKPFLDDLEAFL